MAFTLSCSGDDGNDGGGSTAIEGTWNASGERSCTFSGNNFTYKVNGATQYSGTFSVSGSVITWTVSGVAVTSNFQLSGNTLTISNHSYDSSIDGTYTKEGGGGNPFVGTWIGTLGNDYMKLVCTDNTWTTAESDFGTYSGNYTRNGSTASFYVSGQGVGTATVSGTTMTGNIQGSGFTVTKQ
jgi:hypothetical protein